MPVDKQNNLKKLDVLIKLLDEMPTKKEFVESFANVVTFVKKIEKKNDEAIARIEETYKNLLTKAGKDSKVSLDTLKSTVKADTDDLFAQYSKKVDAKMSKSDSMIATMQKHHAGVIADIKALSEKVDGIEMPTVTDLENDLPKLGERIRDGLELLQDDARLDKSAIKGLKEEFEKLEKRINQIGQGRSAFGGPNANAIQVADLTTQCDGATKTFEVPRHRFALDLRSTQYPIIYRPITDFTTANKTLTLTDEVSAPEAGQTLLFVYIK